MSENNRKNNTTQENKFLVTELEDRVIIRVFNSTGDVIDCKTIKLNRNNKLCMN